MKKITLLSLIILLFSQTLFTQNSSSLNWSVYYSNTTVSSSKQDSNGNTYTTGNFVDYSNFKDDSSLDAIDSEGGQDGYMAKYNSSGELEWVNTFGGIHNDLASDMAIASDGNIIVIGSIRSVVTFSDGSTFDTGLTRDPKIVFLKLNSTTGEIIWKKLMDDDPLYAIVVKLDSNDNIIAGGQYEDSNSSLNFSPYFMKLNYSDGNTLAYESLEPAQSFRDLIIDSNDNIIITGSYYDTLDADLSAETYTLSTGESSQSTYFIKYDSSFNLVWGMAIGAEGPDEGYSLAYDATNDMIYLSAFISSYVNINPLGSAVNLNGEGTRGFIGVYNSSGILQRSHVYSGLLQSDNASSAVMTITDNKLVLLGKYRGKPDMDLTNEIIKPIVDGNNKTRFVSIYDISSSENLIGQYYLGEFSTRNTGNRSFAFLNGNNLTVISDQENNIELYDYDNSSLVSTTNTQDTSSSSYSAIVNFNIQLNNFPLNIAPVASNSSNTTFKNNSVNIPLSGTDSNEDALTYIITTNPINGSASISGSTLIYIPSNNFIGNDNISFKVNDGQADSNIADIQVNVIDQASNLNWSVYYSNTTVSSSKQDSNGNTYTTGNFVDYSNFKDDSSLDAIDSEGGQDGYMAKYNSSGELEWVNTFGGIHNDLASDMAIASDGNIIVIGSIRSVVTFSDGSTFDTGLTRDPKIVFLKLNSTTGEIIWKKLMDDDPLYAIVVKLDSNDNIIAGGQYEDSNSSLNFSPYFMKLNYSDGNTLAYESLEPAQSFRDLIIDSNDNIIITGSYYDTLDADLSAETYTLSTGESSQSTYFIKYDSSFNLVWGMAIGAEGPDEGYSLAYDATNDMIYLSAFISSYVNINPLGSAVNLNGEGTRGFIGVYNSSGILQRSHVFPGGSVWSIVMSINNEKLVLIGRYRDKPDFDMSEGSLVPYTDGDGEYFVSMYDLDLSETLVSQYYLGYFNNRNSGNKSFAYLNGNNLTVISDQENNIELYDYDNSSLVSTTNTQDTSSSTYSAIVNFNIELNVLDNSLIVENSNLELFNIYPNPSSDIVYIDGNYTQLKVVVYDILGKQVMKESITNSIDISQLEKGVYILQLSDGAKVSTQRIIKK